MARRGEAALLVLLGLPTAVIDWQIAQTWKLPAWISLLAGGVALAALGLGLWRPRLGAVASGLAVAVLYALPVIGGIIRWRLLASPVALIGDGAYQAQIAREVLMRGVDPYGFNYVGTGLEKTPWSQPFANPALHHLDYWPGTVVIPLPVQAAFKAVFGWWDERLWLLLAGVAIWIILGRLAPGPIGRMAAIAMFLIPGHSLLAILGDNDLSMVAWLLAAALALGNRRWILSGLLLGIAIATKQTALIAVPVFVLWAAALGVERRRLLQATAAAAIVVAVLLLPFLLWNWRAFVADTILFNFGGGAETYPVQGIGLSALFLHMGIIHGARDAFPFLLIQLPLVGAAYLAAWRWLRGHQRCGDALLWIGVSLFVFLFTNRFAQPTYLLLGMELILAGCLLRLNRPPSMAFPERQAAAA